MRNRTQLTVRSASRLPSVASAPTDAAGRITNPRGSNHVFVVKMADTGKHGGETDDKPWTPPPEPPSPDGSRPK